MFSDGCGFGHFSFGLDDIGQIVGYIVGCGNRASELLVTVSFVASGRANGRRKFSGEILAKLNGDNIVR